MGNLASVKCYLSGAIESANSAPYQAKGWRQKITPKLQELGIVVYDPLVKPKWMPEVSGATQREMAKNLDEGITAGVALDKIELHNNMTRIFCLNLVRHANIIIVKIDKTFTVGTFEEIKLAEGKPIFIIADGIPSMWLIDQLDLYAYYRRDLYLHSTIDKCLNKLEHINNNTNLINDKLEWIFLKNFWETGE